MLSVAQLFLMRLTTAWATELVPLIQPVQWPLMGISLVVPLVLGCLEMKRIGKRQVIDVSQSSTIIVNLCKSFYVLASTFLSLFVLAYKIRADDAAPPAMYAGLLDMEIIQRLDQPSLGQLIYNYAGATLLLLAAVIYVTRRASLLDLDAQHGKKKNRKRTEYHQDWRD